MKMLTDMTPIVRVYFIFPRRDFREWRKCRERQMFNQGTCRS